MERVRVEMTKWGGTPHWRFDTSRLGEDQHGTWLGIPAGTVHTRPGARFVSPGASVTLVPGPGPEAGRGFLATFWAAPGPVAVYVDVTTPPVLSGRSLAAVDLDLDVVAGRTGRVWVDDEDEFAAHRVGLGYPASVVEAALASCARVQAAVLAGHPPYDGTAQRWLAQV